MGIEYKKESSNLSHWGSMRMIEKSLNVMSLLLGGRNRHHVAILYNRHFNMYSQ